MTYNGNGMKRIRRSFFREAKKGMKLIKMKLTVVGETTIKIIRNTFWNKVKKYRENHRDLINERSKTYRETNKDTIKERQKQYRESHKDGLRESKKQHYEANKDKINEARRQKYLLKKGSEDNVLTV